MPLHLFPHKCLTKILHFGIFLALIIAINYIIFIIMSLLANNQHLSGRIRTIVVGLLLYDCFASRHLRCLLLQLLLQQFLINNGSNKLKQQNRVAAL